MVWTEIVSEDIADVHIGDRHVLVPLSEDISEGHVRKVMDSIVMEECMTEHYEQLREQLKLNQKIDEIMGHCCGPNEVFPPQ